jgi:hypothetical protein
VYEFVTPEEFHLDLKHMMLDEMEGWSLWIGVIAFAAASLAEGVRRIANWGGVMV